MGKLGKFILTTIIVGIVFGIGFYYASDVSVKCTIILAYGMFLLIYGMIIANPFKPTPNVYEFEYEYEVEVEEEQTKSNNEK